MAIIDLPLEELKKYKGTNPCPPDFEEYWNTALEESKKLPKQIEMIPTNFSFPNANCYDLYFNGVGNARVHAKLLIPTHHKELKPAVLHFHGYAGNSGGWSDKLAYTNSGFIVASLDCRGQGGQSQDISSVVGNTFHGHIIRGLDDNPQKMLFRQIFLDTVVLAQIVMGLEEVDKTKVMTMGISQGGALALACAALEPRIAKVAALHPFLSDYQRVVQMGFTEHAYKELVEYFRLFDPQHLRENDIFTRLGYIDVHHLARKIKSPVLMGITLSDPVCPPSSQYAIYNNLSGEKQSLIFPDFAHEIPPGYLDSVMHFLLSSTC